MFVTNGSNQSTRLPSSSNTVRRLSKLVALIDPSFTLFLACFFFFLIYFPPLPFCPPFSWSAKRCQKCLSSPGGAILNAEKSYTQMKVGDKRHATFLPQTPLVRSRDGGKHAHMDVGRSVELLSGLALCLSLAQYGQAMTVRPSRTNETRPNANSTKKHTAGKRKEDKGWGR